jgi:formylglycine-generating enzyme required for sulfatase activity
MASPSSTLDFDLEISPGQGRDYPLEVHSSAGEARLTLHFPFDDLALTDRLKDLQIALLRSGGKRRQALTKEERAVQDFGGQLFDALLPGEARARYAVARTQAARAGQTLRLRLRIAPPELACLPWEFLFDRQRGEYLCLAAETPLVRYLEQPQPIPSITITPPLRILGLVSAPTDLPELDVANEKARVEKALAGLTAGGLVQLDWLPAATWRDLQAALRPGKGPWHVFHFIGHGSFDANRDEGLLAFCDERGAAQMLTATAVGRLLEGHKPLRLALLNACESATGSQRDIFSSTAAILSRRLPAVLAMQYEITDAAAVEFARTFYESLADRLPVDLAVTEARKAISIAVSNSLEWGTPVLYLRASDGQLFDWEAVGQTSRLLVAPESADGQIGNLPHQTDPALAMARRALALLEQQAAGYTSLTMPAHLQIELEDKRRQVRELVGQISDLPAAPASAGGQIGNLPHVLLELSASPNPAPTGAPVTWTVAARNTGRAAARNLALLRGSSLLGEEFDLPAGEGCSFTFSQTYKKPGDYPEGVRLYGAPQPCAASASVTVFAPPDFTLELAPAKPETPPHQPLTWGVRLRNTGGADLTRLLVRLGSQALAEPFDLPAAAERTLTFQRRYAQPGQSAESVLAAALTPQGERLERKASASVNVVAPLRTLLNLAPGIPMELVRIPAGEFLMGSDTKKDSQARDDETPQHKVTLDEYWIGKTPVTNAQYAVYAKAAGKKFEMPKGKENHPVVDVTWNDAAAFCQWLSQASGQNVRLPTEAEWEKAARGSDGRIYPWGDEWDAKKCNTRESGIGGTTPVGKFSPQGDSPYGCVDMAGNVWEWCADWYADSYYANSPTKNPAGPEKGDVRALRGGSFYHDAQVARCALRLRHHPPDGNWNLGFRVWVVVGVSHYL